MAGNGDPIVIQPLIPKIIFQEERIITDPQLMMSAELLVDRLSMGFLGVNQLPIQHSIVIFGNRQ